MKKIFIVGILLLFPALSLWSMEQDNKRKCSDSENQSESDQITNKKAKTHDEDDNESLCYFDLIPEEILLLIIHDKNLNDDIHSCDVDRALGAYKQYNILRSVNTTFRRILPAIPLSMHYLPIIRNLFLGAAKTGNLAILQFLCDGNFVSIKRALSNDKKWFDTKKRSDSEYAKKIMPRGFNLNKFSYEDWLIYAIGQRNIKFCQMLIQNNLLDEVENAPLIHAIILQNIEQVKALIGSGNGEGLLFGKYTETMVAATCGNVEIFKLFVPYIRNYTIRHGSIYSTSLRCAAKNGHREIVQALLRVKNDYGKLKYDYDDDRDRMFALVEAAGENQIEIAHILLAMDPDSINDATADYFSMTALGNACKYGHEQMVRFLLRKQADPNIKFGGRENGTALKLACRSNNIAIVQLLLYNNTDPNACNNWPALMVAIQKGNLEIAKLLALYKANINIVANSGYTPLGQAAKLGYLEIVKWLVSQKVDINHKDEEGSTAADGARINGHKEILAFLLQNGGIETLESIAETDN